MHVCIFYAQGGVSYRLMAEVSTGFRLLSIAATHLPAAGDDKIDDDGDEKLATAADDAESSSAAASDDQNSSKSEASCNEDEGVLNLIFL